VLSNALDSSVNALSDQLICLIFISGFAAYLVNPRNCHDFTVCWSAIW